MPDIPGNKSTTATLDGAPHLGGTFSGTLEKIGDHDWIRVQLAESKTYEFYLCFLDTGSLTSGDSILRLHDATGALIPGAEDDNGGVGDNSYLAFSVPAGAGGDYFIDVGESGDDATGTYSLFVGPFNAGANKQLTDNDDSYLGAAGERILGGKGIDGIAIGDGNDALGEQGDDELIGNASGNRIAGGLGNDKILGNDGDDYLFGDAGNDEIHGGDGIDDIRGGGGSDTIDGGLSSDIILGGRGKDFLTGGADSVTSSVQDAFVFTALADSKKGAARDVIEDFANPDVIYLTQIDAKKGVAGNQHFHWIGKQHFHDAKGELHYRLVNHAGTTHDVTLVEGDVNGDGRPDFQIQLTGLLTLTGDDFGL
jgi:Ca2+-binding RTX toxin-like protein